MRPRWPSTVPLSPTCRYGRVQMARARGQTGGRATSTAPTRAHRAAGRHGPRNLGHAGPRDARVGLDHLRPADAVVADRTRTRRQRHGGVHRPRSRHRAGPTSTTARAGSSSSTASTPSTSTRRTSSTPPGPAVEFLGGRRLAHGPPGSQRGAPGDDLERPRAGDGPGQRPGHLRTWPPDGPPPVQPGHPRPLRASTCDQDREPAGALPHPVILDMHQDVYNQMFDGEGAPSWAVCTNGVQSVDTAGALVARVRHQGGRHRLQSLLAQRRPGRSAGPVRQGVGRRGPRLQGNRGSSATTPSTSRSPRRWSVFGDEHFDAELECFYTGTAHIGAPSTVARRCAAPRATRPTAWCRRIAADDPTHLIFDEPDNYASRGLPDLHRGQ